MNSTWCRKILGIYIYKIIIYIIRINHKHNEKKLPKPKDRHHEAVWSPFWIAPFHLALVANPHILWSRKLWNTLFCKCSIHNAKYTYIYLTQLKLIKLYLIYFFSHSLNEHKYDISIVEISRYYENVNWWMVEKHLKTRVCKSNIVYLSVMDKV